MDFRTNLILKGYFYSSQHYRVFSDNGIYPLSCFSQKTEEFLRAVSLYKESFVAQIFSPFSDLFDSQLYKIYDRLNQINFFKNENDWLMLQRIDYLSPQKTLLLIKMIKTFKSIPVIEDSQRKRCIDFILKKLINNEIQDNQSINQAILSFGECWPLIEGFESVLIDILFKVENRQVNDSLKLVNALIPIIKSDININLVSLLKTLSSSFLPETIFKLLGIMNKKGLVDGDEWKMTFEALIGSPLIYHLKKYENDEKLEPYVIYFTLKPYSIIKFMALSNENNQIEIDMFLYEYDMDYFESLKKTYFDRGLTYAINQNNISSSAFTIDMLNELKHNGGLPVLMDDITTGCYRFLNTIFVNGITSSINTNDIHNYLQLIAGSSNPIKFAYRLTMLHSIDLLDRETAIANIEEIQLQRLFPIIELFKKAQISFPKAYIKQFLMHHSLEQLAHLIISCVRSDRTCLCDKQITVDLSPFFLIQSISTFNHISMLLRNNYLLTYDNFIRMIAFEDQLLHIAWEDVSLHTALNQSNIEDILKLAKSCVDARQQSNASSRISEYLNKKHPRSRDDIFHFRSILKSKTLFSSTGIARNYSKISTELERMYPQPKVLKYSIIYNIIQKMIWKYSRSYIDKSVNFAKAQSSLEMISQCSNRNSPIISRLSLNKLLYLCYESIKAHNKQYLEKNWMQLIQTLADIELIKTDQETGCNPKHVFEDLIKLILFLNPNLITIVRDFSARMANEHLEYLIGLFTTTCSMDHAEYSWEKGIIEIGHHIYKEFQTEQERYLPNTGLFPDGRESQQCIDFVERAIKIKPFQQDNIDIRKIGSVDQSSAKDIRPTSCKRGPETDRIRSSGQATGRVDLNSQQTLDKYVSHRPVLIDLHTKESPRGSFFKSANDNKIYPFSNDSLSDFSQS